MFAHCATLAHWSLRMHEREWRAQRCVAVETEERQVHAFPTSWYRIHPSMFTDAHETLQELHPSDFVTPLDTALRDFIRFRDGRGAYPARWEDPL